MHNNLPPIPAAPFRFVRVSSNRKTGPIAVTSTAAQSCPVVCPMRTDERGGCYASSGNTAIHWRQLTEGRAGTAVDAEQLFALVRSLPKQSTLRHNEAGDLPHNNQQIDAGFLRGLTDAIVSRDLAGFTYTHHALDVGNNAALIAQANAEGFTVNISTNNPQHADKVRAAFPALPVVTLMSPDAWNGKNTAQTPQGNTVVRCPAEYIDDMTCAACKLCAKTDRRGIVGFTAHGTGKRRVIAIASAAV